jgi:hypothetical protein
MYVCILLRICMHACCFVCGGVFDKMNCGINRSTTQQVLSRVMQLTHLRVSKGLRLRLSSNGI